MMICVECTAAVIGTYKEYSPGNIKLTVCPRCNCIADKYVEYEMVLVALDLLLLKDQAFRHILYNRATTCPVQLWKCIVICIAVDAVVEWTAIETIGHTCGDVMLHGLVGSWEEPGDEDYHTLLAGAWHSLTGHGDSVGVDTRSIISFLFFAAFPVALGYIIFLCIIIFLVELGGLYDGRGWLVHEEKQRRPLESNPSDRQKDVPSIAGSNPPIQPTSFKYPSGHVRKSKMNCCSDSRCSAGCAAACGDGRIEDKSGNRTTRSEEGKRSLEETTKTNGISGEDEFQEAVSRSKLLVLAILASSGCKLVVVLMVIWEYSVDYFHMLAFMVTMANIEAVRIQAKTSYLRAGSIVTLALLCRTLVMMRVTGCRRPNFA